MFYAILVCFWWVVIFSLHRFSRVFHKGSAELVGFLDVALLVYSAIALFTALGYSFYVINLLFIEG